jgi:hypothetical protein
MAQETTINSIIRFTAWMEGSGEQKAGLPQGTLSTLNQSGLSLQAKAMGLRNNLLRIRDCWLHVKNGQASGDEHERTAIKAVIRLVVVELSNLQVSTDGMRTDAAAMKVQLALAESAVQSHIAADKIRLQQLALDAAQAARELALGKIGLQQAREQLNGWNGFLNGLATGFTFGLYNPVLDNINKANAAVASLHNEVAKLNNLRSLQTRYQSEQTACVGLLSKLDGIDQALTDLQNGLRTAASAIGNAHKSESKYLDAGSESIAAYYLKSGGTYMDKLFAWMTAFFGLGAVPSLAPAGIVQSLLGNFECRAFDGTSNKNNWHYVTVFPLSGQSVLWGNRAGVSWLMHLTTDRNRLAIGPDCTYYNVYKEAKIHWKGDAVTGITGPGNSVYERS